ncbi:MAG: APC family permease [Acidobacteria bacterium]|nr:APC family permease [Acidobacteriota bacterium]
MVLEMGEGVTSAAVPSRLLRILGVAFGLAVTVGGTVGVSILRAPGPVAARFEAPSVPLIMGVWLLGGLFILISACSIAELATMLPQAGGYYVYTRRAFGDAVGFTAGWVDWLTQCAALAYLGMSMAEFSAALWPALAHSTKAGSTLLILALAALQWNGTRINGRAQEIASAVQACGFLLFVAACFAFGNPPAARAADRQSAVALWFPTMLALRLVIAAFDGWYCAIYFTEEVRNPGRDLPRSMLGGVVAVVAVYLLFNAALLHVLPVSALPGLTLPAADAAALLFGESERKLAILLCLIALPAAFHSALLCATRIAFAMSRDSLFWVDASSVNRRGTPGLALALSALAAILLSVSGTFEQLLTWVGVLNVATYCAALASLLTLRRREPRAVRPFSVQPYPWLTLLALAGGCLLLTGAAQGDPKSTFQALGLIVAAYPVYQLSRWFRHITKEPYARETSQKSATSVRASPRLNRPNPNRK